MIEHDKIEFGKYILELVKTDIGWVHLTACDFKYRKKDNRRSLTSSSLKRGMVNERNLNWHY